MLSREFLLSEIFTAGFHGNTIFILGISEHLPVFLLGFNPLTFLDLLIKISQRKLELNGVKMKLTISYLCQRNLSCAQHTHSCRLAPISVMFSYPFHLNAQGLLWFSSGDALAWFVL